MLYGMRTIKASQACPARPSHVNHCAKDPLTANKEEAN